MATGGKMPRTERGCPKAGSRGIGRRRLGLTAVAVALTIVIFTPTAAAGPTLTWQVVDLPGGLYGCQFTVECSDSFMEPVWAELTYAGYDPDVHYSKYGPGIPAQIQNIRAFGAIDVHEEPYADTYDALDPNYTKHLDSWLNEGFCHDIRTIAGGGPTDNYFYVDSGTEAGLAFDHAYIVCTETCIVIEGRIRRHGVWYDVSLGPMMHGLICADAGGPYQVGPGEEVTLDGTESEGDDPIDSWLWDLDNDGSFDDASGQQVVVTYDYLVAGLGLPLGEHTIGLEITAAGLVGRDTATLHIIPEPTSLGLLAMGGLVFIRRR